MAEYKVLCVKKHHTGDECVALLSMLNGYLCKQIWCCAAHPPLLSSKLVQLKRSRRAIIIGNYSQA